MASIRPQLESLDTHARLQLVQKLDYLADPRDAKILA